MGMLGLWTDYWFGNQQWACELSKTYTEDALMTLEDVVRNGRTEAARVAAANSFMGARVSSSSKQYSSFIPHFARQLQTDFGVGADCESLFLALEAIFPPP